MNQKVIKVGNSLGITLPKAFVNQKKLSAGQIITTSIDSTTGILKVKPKSKTADKVLKASLSPDFVDRVDSFINRYKPALKKLSKL